MFSLKFDLLFPSFGAAKDAAKKLNSALATPRPPADPREHKRMLDELRHARDDARLRAAAYRGLFL